MAIVLSIDLCSRVVAAVDDGMSRRGAVSRFGISYSAAIRWVRQARETGDIAPKPQGGARRPSIIDRHADLAMGWVEAEPDLTLMEIAMRLAYAVGYQPPPSVVHEFFKRHGLTRKTRRRTRPSRTVHT